VPPAAPAPPGAPETAPKPASGAPGAGPATGSPASGTAPASSAQAAPGAAPSDPPEKPGSRVPDPGAASIGAASVADVVAEVELGAVDENAETHELAVSRLLREPDTITPAEVEGVLNASATTTSAERRDDAPPIPEWARRGIKRRKSRWWSAAAVLALVLLVVQGVNHFRTELVSHRTIGPYVERAYAMIGIAVTPRWDVRQYAIVDWVANAEPNARGQGTLNITARIRNQGPRRQPYPLVNLRLKDRYEETVATRTFAPGEYLPRETPRGRLMTAGETVRAEITVVDPGPDAYGFELDVCIAVETNVLSCGTDKVFL
jgi:hypothetical protein